MKKTKQKTSSVTITFYVLAVLLVLVFAFMLWYIFDSIKEAMTQYGMSFSEFWGEMWQSVVNMFVTQSLPFLVYAFISYGIGYVINELTLQHTESVQNADAKAESKEAAAMEQTDTKAQDELSQAPAKESVQEEMLSDEGKEETQAAGAEPKQEESANEDNQKQEEEANTATLDSEEKESQA